VQRSNQRGFQVLCKLDNEAAALTTEYSVLVLQANRVQVPQVQEIGSQPVFVQSVLADLNGSFSAIAAATSAVNVAIPQRLGG